MRNFRESITVMQEINNEKMSKKKKERAGRQNERIAKLIATF